LADGRVSIARVHLPWGGKKPLAASDFGEVTPSPLRARGGGEPARRVWWASLGAGIALEPDLPVAWQGLELAVSARLPAGLRRLLLTGSLGWRGRSFDLETSPQNSIRADSLLVAAGAALCFDIGPTVLATGVRGRLELVFQRETPPESERLRAAGLDAPPLSKTLRFAALYDLGWTVPLFTRLSWFVRASAGVALQPSEGDGLSGRPLFEMTTGPLLVW
jgi:hypothetical protein